jgi:hypothetical protein
LDNSPIEVRFTEHLIATLVLVGYNVLFSKQFLGQGKPQKY